MNHVTLSSIFVLEYLPFDSYIKIDEYFDYLNYIALPKLTDSSLYCLEELLNQ